MFALKADFPLPTCAPYSIVWPLGTTILESISQNPPSVTSNVKPVSKNIVIWILTRLRIDENSQSLRSKNKKSYFITLPNIRYEQLKT
jgi:hypothetical protein